jgi:hypothetical protein
LELEGWAWDEWKGGIKMHYFRNYRSLCKQYSHPYGIFQKDYDESLKCKNCMKRLEMKK